jgi:hypothetical protein
MPGGIHPSLLVEGSWPQANYVDPAHHGPGIVGLVAVLSSFAVITVALRLWVRVRLQSNGGLDDLFITAALVSPLFVPLSVKWLISLASHPSARHCGVSR